MRTRTALFAYQPRDVYMATEPLLSEPREGVVRFQVGSVNGGTTSAWGGEALVEARLTPHLTLSYSHQDLSGTLDDQVTEKGTPHDKSSGKVRYRRAGWVADAVLHRAGTVSWNTNRLTDLIPAYKSVEAYTLLDVSLRYRFQQRLRGLEVQLVAANALGNQHHEVLPALNILAAGQSGEEIAHATPHCSCIVSDGAPKLVSCSRSRRPGAVGGSPASRNV
ncbi:MAG: hypothetical protein VCF24_26265 [Candidatus Latescibacterota bacterium]